MYTQARRARWSAVILFMAVLLADHLGQRQCGPDAGVDGVDRDAGAEVPAIEIEILLVVIDAGGPAAAAIVLLSRSVRVAGRPFSGSASVGGELSHQCWHGGAIKRSNVRVFF